MPKTLNDILKELDSLPTPNFVVAKVLELVGQPDVSASQLTEVIEKDPNLTVRIMKLSNSAYYGLPQKITTLSHAVMILGFKTVRNLVASIYTYDTFFSSKAETGGISPDKMWQHLIGTAIATEQISDSVGFINKEEAFLVGMLHDLGKMVLAKLFPNYTEAIVKLASTKSMTYRRAEEALELPDHVSIAGYLMEKWKFPQNIRTPIDYHHNPSDMHEELFRDLTYITHAADVMANTLDSKLSGNYAIPVINKDVWFYLKLNGSSFLETAKTTREMIKKAVEFFNMK